MNVNKINQRYNSACITASHLLEQIKNVCEQLNSQQTAEDKLETAGTILGDVASLSGSVTLLLIDIDAVVKSDE